MSDAMYDKGEGTSGIRGQLYETKLLSLIFYRAKHDDSVEEFQLASNIADIGAFDDICVRVKLKGIAKPLLVCMQAKHKEHSEQTPDIDIIKYFRSYLKIRERFESDNKDELFQGKFQETESYFVIYTSGKDIFGDDSVVGELASQLNNLIDTGGTAKQPYKHDADVKHLCEIFIKDQTISLAKKVADFISDEKNFQMMLTDELMLKYHVVLALKVFDISVTSGHRIAFRQDFFDTKEEYLSLFKDTLYKEVLKTQKIKLSVAKDLLSKFLSEPSDVTKLSKLIETVITYDNGQLEFVKTFTKLQTEFKQQLNQVDVSRSTVNKAIDLAAREMLSKGLKAPAAFGNKDLTLSGGDERRTRRIQHLTSVFVGLLAKSKSGNIVTVDNSVDSGFLLLNGGIAGAIGNLFVLDDDTKLMKITDNWQSLGDLARALYKNLTDEIQDLHELRFSFEVNKFPKLSFDCSAYEETLARDFLSRLLFYSKQADEHDVEQIIKDKIEEYQVDNPNYFQAKTDAMFLKYHDKIQKWWMQPKQAPYLTKNSDIFENAINNIIKDPLLSSVNMASMSKIKHVIEYTFTDDAVSSWNLLEHSGTIVVTENCTLTVVKVLQHLNNTDHVVLDLQYIVNLPMNERNVLCTELKNANTFNFLIFVFDKMQNSRDEIKTLENIAKVVHTKNKVFVTNSTSVETLQKYFQIADSPVHDETSLMEMSVDTQESILNTARVMFQGVEVSLDSIVDDKSKAYIKGDILNKIIHNNTVELGTLNVSKQYDDIKYLYFDRTIQKLGPTTTEPVKVKIKTLYDIKDDVVLVTAEPGMGKTTLLTRLSLETKKCHPKVWIVRINLLEYSRELNHWKENETDINTLETLKLMCDVILREKLGKENNVDITLEEQNGVVYLKRCTGDQWTEFELKIFLHFFNDGKMIFLFDGVDEICPYYMDVAIKCIQVINNHRQKHKIWVTSRSYSEIQKLLQEAFGNPYTIERMSLKQKYEYLKKIWEKNLVVSELDKSQLENVDDFLKFMEGVVYPHNYTLNPFEWSLHEVYTSAWKYFKNPKNLTERQKYIDFALEIIVKLKQQKGVLDIDREEFGDHTPLQLFLKANFLINNIKSVDKKSNKWNYDVNTLNLYQQYLETSLKTIRFGHKNEMDIYKPDIMNVYKKELADCILMHKQLAAYAIFNKDIETLFTEKELNEIKETIKRIEKGGEKTGLICGVANDIPIFIHMTFTEYFAVEYVCDLIRNENEQENLIKWIDFIFDVWTSTNFSNLNDVLHYKIKNDQILISKLNIYKEAVYKNNPLKYSLTMFTMALNLLKSDHRYQRRMNT
ncbi:hypothetical protein PYW08_012871 [Mythimna loreyi]|uniref:Uncharacterized protein n=1 Tax=Mythimna loreyi TaxID=667449 RepID=A0ACC2Q1P7_9NEOP|nr:hypothetical protein PYW08_012871 [Mythimna loreyi]